MQITLYILDYKGNLVTSWHWDSNRELPQKGDSLLIHIGDNNDEEYRVYVLRREFDGFDDCNVRIITDYVKFKECKKADD